MPNLSGVKFSACSSGIKNEGLDLGLVYFEEPHLFVSAYTRNRVKAAHIHYMKKMEGKKIKALLVTSGCANAATGKEGVKDLERLAEVFSKNLPIEKDQIIFASTGVIGKRLPLDKIIDSIPHLKKNLDSSRIEDFAKAIMTTDTYHKIAKGTFVGRREYILVGVAKGAGMINPLFGTMLSFLFTDFPLRREVIIRPFRASLKESFERITVDCETSTNDTVVLFFPEGPLDEEGYPQFLETLKGVMRELALLIVRDGEGATKVIHVNVRGAKRKKDAEKLARRIARSTLVKTAFFGNDPNWGRIMAAIGDAEVDILPERIDILIQGERIVKGGKGTDFDEELLKRRLSAKDVELEVNLNEGKASFDLYTTDMTYEYVRINASYRS